MLKNILMLIVIMSLTSCQKYEELNLDINVSGKVSDQNNNGITNITIYVLRRKTGMTIATPNELYHTTTTNSTGNYSYLVKNDLYHYTICCDIPTGYSIEGESCKEVNQNVVNNKTIPNTISFKLNF